MKVNINAWSLGDTDMKENEALEDSLDWPLISY